MIKTGYYQDLTKMNTFGMKVKARCFIEYDSVADLVDLEFSELAQPVLHIGGGSNLLFTGDFKGTVLHSKINFIEVLDGVEPSRRISAVPFASAKCSKNIEAATAPVNAQKGIDGMPPRGLSCSDWGVESQVVEDDAPTETKTFVSVGAGVVFDEFCAWAAQQGLWGVENLSYIPGEVGASAVQNIGAYGVEVKDVIHKVYCYDTVEEEFVSFSVEECGYGYRDSIFKKPEVKGRYIVTHVVFALSREPMPRLDYGHLATAVAEATSDGDDMPPPAMGRERPGKWSCGPLQRAESLRGRGSAESDVASAEVQRITPSLIREIIIKIRKEKLPEPSVMGSAGSFFKNPVISVEHFSQIEAAAKAEYGPDYKVPHYDLPDDMVKVPAAWMIEQCGWKGKRSGGAAVWDKQPLVIVNYTGEAYPEEIIGLERRIIDSVRQKFGIELHPEVEHI